MTPRPAPQAAPGRAQPAPALDAPPGPPSAVVPPAVAPSSGPIVWPLWLAVLLLAGACGYLSLQLPADPRPIVAQQVAIALGGLDRRLAALENRPQPAAPDLAPLATRITALEARPAGATAQAVAEAIAPLAARIGALEQRPVPPAGASPEQLAALAQRVTALEARPVDADLAARVAAVETTAAISRAGVAAAIRLAAGEPLAPALAMLPAGTPAPPALQRFAALAPPTEAVLRRDFPAAARAAREAATTGDADPVATVRNFLNGLVTVRRGEEVVLGTSDAAALAAAESHLDGGDLAGAVAALAALSPKAVEAIAPWRARAQALLDARAALGTLAS